MTYVPKPWRELAKWMTLKEALFHIVTVEKCDEQTAERQLRFALAEGEVPATWPLDYCQLRDRRIQQIFLDAADRDACWRMIDIDVQAGTIPRHGPFIYSPEFKAEMKEKYRRERQHRLMDGSSPENMGDGDTAFIDLKIPSEPAESNVYCEVWVLKESIYKYWNDAQTKESKVEPPTDHEPTGTIVEHPTKAVNPRKASLEEVIDAFRQSFKELEELKKPQPDVYGLRALLAHRIGKPIAKKDFDRVFDRPEFAKYQRPAGQPKKK